jgi:dihydropyrimidinase
MGENEIGKEEAFVIFGGTLINPNSSRKTDIAVKNGKIHAIGRLRQSDFEGYQFINATGKYVLPGGIDPHVHLALPTPAGNSSDDFVSGTKAALSGGTTSIIDFVTPRRGQSLVNALKMRRAESGQSLCNWKLHMGISEWNEKVREEVSYLMLNEGITSFKAYLAYRESIGITLDELRELMVSVKTGGGLVLVHCEDGEKIDQLRKQYISEGKTNACYHALSHPEETEIEAIHKVIGLSEQTGCSVYIVHTSTGKGAQLIREAKEKGLSVYGETCIQYLILDDEVYDNTVPNEEVLPFIISPPIRSFEQQQILWKELTKGTFDTVATDHCPFNLRGQKDLGNNDFTLIPNGAGGIEFRLSLLYTYGVLAGMLTMEQLVRITSTRAAEIFGWGHNKGKILPGYDADIVVWNPETSAIIHAEQQVQQCDSNIYEGIPIKGKAEWVLMNGKLS